MLGGILRVKYTGAQASCILEADTTANTLTSKIGAAGAETVDPNFGVAGVLDLTLAANNTMAKLQPIIGGYADYSAGIHYYTTNAIDSGGILDAKIQAKNVWAYLLFDIASVLDTANALITWTLAKDMLGYEDEQQTVIERIINAAS